MDALKLEPRQVLALVLASALIGALAAVLIADYLPKSNAQMAKDFYAVETAVSVSPADFASSLELGKTDGLLVDLRTKSEYEAGHMVTAVNIPAGTMDEAQLVAAFKQLPNDKPIITYCYSSYCMLSRKVGKALADSGIYVKHLTAGWYEINRDFSAYVATGASPGTFKASANGTGLVCTPKGNGEFGC